ncbi:MAG: hypothetical protein PVSMB1_14700 [Gemmatimonadaceae bacterium]
MTGAHYLDDPSKQRLETLMQLDLHLFTGLSLNLFGNVEFLRDQIYLPRADATPESILLRQHQLATSYRYFLGVGFSYTFGSIFNNIVNPRFPAAGGNLF